jgi:hypothetical protein
MQERVLDTFPPRVYQLVTKGLVMDLVQTAEFRMGTTQMPRSNSFPDEFQKASLV